MDRMHIRAAPVRCDAAKGTNGAVGCSDSYTAGFQGENTMGSRRTSIALAIGTVLLCCTVTGAPAAIPSAHVYHNHMPNFWPFYAVDVGNAYNATAVGAPIR